jgi:hypothetical protein
MTTKKWEYKAGLKGAKTNLFRLANVSNENHTKESNS